MSEYAQTYGHLPQPSDSWALFLSLTRKASRFWARRQLVTFDAVADGVSALFGDGADGQRIRDELERQAYPTAKDKGRPLIVQNAWADADPEESPDA